MCKGTYVLLLLLCSVLFSGGCAKKEVLTPAEPIVPAVQALPETVPPVPEKPAPLPVPPISSTVVQEPASALLQQQTTAEAAPHKQAFLEAIHFDFDMSDLREPDRAILDKNAALMLDTIKGNVQIEGHCDERGSSEYNIALGERRARSAMQYLVTLGVPPERISTISYGEEKPVDPGHDEAAWAKNRRAEFVKSGE